MKLTSADDTIAAAASPSGRGAVGVIRISGTQAKTIAETLCGIALVDRYAHYARCKAADGAVIDEAVAIYFQAPASYTGEDMVEVQAHANPVITEQLLSRLIELGARHAEPGEFSRRAFANGKRDLAQLSAVAGLIESASAEAARSAQRVLQGEFSNRVDAICAGLRALRAEIEASLDFPDEEVDIIADQKMVESLETLVEQLTQLAQSTQTGARLIEGMEVVIAGRPNVGKSSLLNALTQRDTAIVADVPGTTRDIVHSHILIDGLPLVVLDTAGLYEEGETPCDAIEREGVARAHAAVQQADLILIVVDATQGWGKLEQQLLERLQQDPAAPNLFIVYNKIDLLDAPESATQDTATTVSLSAKTGAGLDTLRSAIKQLAGLSEHGDQTQDALAVSRRYVDEIRHACHTLSACAKRAREAQNLQGTARDLIAEDLRNVQQSLSSLIGEQSTEELLGDIFSRFCIGK